MSHKKTAPQFEISKQITARELSTLLKVSSALAASLDLSVVLQTAIESAVEVIALDTGAIYLLEGDWLYLGATTPPMPYEQQAFLLHPESLHDHPHIKETLSVQRPIYLTDAQTADLTPAEQSICQARSLRSMVFIPLLLKEKPLGVIIVGTTGTVRDFTTQEIDLCRVFSYQVTLAVANARLFKSVQQTNVDLTHAYDATLRGWSLALEMRDQDTKGHTQRVTQLTLELARQMGLTESAIDHIRRGSLLHDIGKMSIPDNILRKRGPLTDEEWAIMRKHPHYAYQFLLQIDYLLPALDIPYCHHERWDGSGYPRGLKGEQIPLPARIFAVADVYDALTTDRAYRTAWQKEAALQYIREQSGKLFDPTVVAIFLSKMGECL